MLTGCVVRRVARNAATAAIVGSMGDALMQHQEGVNLTENLDGHRTARLAAYRCIHAPVVDQCWRYFDRIWPKAGMRGTLLKIVADQSLLMPPSLLIFFLSQSAMEGKLKEECLARMRDSFWPAVKLCVPFWCTMHLITFGVMRPNLRVAWTQVMAVAWNALLSNENEKAKRREGVPGADRDAS